VKWIKVLALWAAAPALASAASHNVSFSGSIDFLQETICNYDSDSGYTICGDTVWPRTSSDGFQGSTIRLGDTFSGSFRLDDSTPEYWENTDGTGGIRRDYPYLLSGLTAQAGEVVLPAAGRASNGQMATVTDGYFGSDFVEYTAWFLPVFQGTLILRDASGQVIGDAGPWQTFDLSKYSQATFFVSYWDLDLNRGAFAQGTLSTLEAVAAPVPEPATWALFGLGLAGLVACTRRARDRRVG